MGLSPDPAEESELIRLETLLLDPGFRRNGPAVAALLAEGFREFGSSGRVYDKAAILELLAAEEAGPAVQATGFEVAFLGPGAALVTYQSRRGEIRAWRSSIWVRTGKTAGWQVLFHQGTLCP